MENKTETLVTLNEQAASTASIVQPTLDLMEQISSPNNVDLLGLSLDSTDSVSNNDFGDFMSAGPLPYMPSQLLLNDLVDLTFDAPPDALNEPETPTATAGDSSKSKKSIMELFNRGGAVRKTAAATQASSSIGEKAKEKKPNKMPNGKANWMDLFAELDPLSNPDLIEKKLSGENSNSQAA